MKINFLFLLLIFLLISCHGTKTTIKNGPHKIDITGEITPLESDSVLPGTEYMPENYIFLSRIGDKAIIYLPADVYFDVKIDTTISTIATSFSPDENKIIFEVVEKKNLNKIVFNNLCDILILPDVNIQISLIDAYNDNPMNKNKSKLIIVPIFDNKCKVTGYLLRFDNRDRPNNCQNNKRVQEIEKKFNECEKNVSLSCSCPKPSYHCDCLEYKYFGKCCPK